MPGLPRQAGGCTRTSVSFGERSCLAFPRTAPVPHPYCSGTAGASDTHLTLVVNCTPVLMTRGRSGCMGMQGCLSTTKALQGKAQEPQSNLRPGPAPLNPLPVPRGLPTAPPSAPFHQVPEQLHNPLLQHGPVLDNRVTLVGHFLLQFFQLFDLLPGL